MNALELTQLRSLMRHTPGSPKFTTGLIGGPVATPHADLPTVGVNCDRGDGVFQFLGAAQATGLVGLLNLVPLMQRTSGSPQVKIGLVDGPVETGHPDLADGRFQELAGNTRTPRAQRDGTARLHGTFVAGILSARRGSLAPAICPDCTLIIRPIFGETAGICTPSATPEELATAILDCMNAGARVINLSLALAQPSISGIRALEEAFDEAIRRGVIVVAAAGNQGTLGSSAITRHPWVIPVVACDDQGRPTNDSNLGISIGRRGLSAFGAGVASLAVEGEPLTLGGTSVATPFVTGAIALLWSAFPEASACQIKFAVTQGSARRRASVVPPLLNAEAAYRALLIER
jgi:subtilisin family serine protease